MSSEEQPMIVVEPKTPTMKRRRGRPLSNKKPAIVLGESFFSIKKRNSFDHEQEPDENETAKVSEAALKKGFNSTPVMKLSPLKNLKKNKSVLLDLSNSSNSNRATTTIKPQKEAFDRKLNTTNRIFETPNRRDKSYEVGSTSNFLSSSPISNMMSSDLNYQGSSPLATSPLRPNMNTSKNTFIGIQNMIQSSPWTGYEDQFNKYINSSPLCAPNTPQRIAKVKKKSSTKKNKKIDLSRYRFNYQYRITLDINERGVAQLFARVLENNTPIYHNKNRNLVGYEKAFYEFQGETGDRHHCDDGNMNDDCIAYAYEKGIYQEGIVPSRFEQYIEACRRYNQERNEMIQNCMKNDVFLTAPTKYPLSAFSSPRQEKTSKGYYNLLEGGVKTVNINNVLHSNKGISAGVQYDYTTRVYQNSLAADDIHLNIRPIESHSNDALFALREVVLNPPQSLITHHSV